MFSLKLFGLEAQVHLKFSFVFIVILPNVNLPQQIMFSFFFLKSKQCEIHLVCCNLMTNVKLRVILYVTTAYL